MLSLVYALFFVEDEPIKVNEYEIFMFEITTQSFDSLTSEMRNEKSFVDEEGTELKNYYSEQDKFCLSYVSDENKLASTLVYSLNASASCIVYSILENQSKMTDALAQKIYNDFRCFSW